MWDGCGRLSGGAASGTDGLVDDIEPEAMSIFNFTPYSIDKLWMEHKWFYRIIFMDCNMPKINEELSIFRVA